MMSVVDWLIDGARSAALAQDVLTELCERLIAGGSTIVLVEQDLARAMRVATRIACMLEGRIVLEGNAADLTREQITDAYFGLRAQGAAT